MMAQLGRNKHHLFSPVKFWISSQMNSQVLSKMTLEVMLCIYVKGPLEICH